MQLIKYDIGCLTETAYVDPITMLLGIEQKDERVEIAIDELMEETGWFEE